MHLLLLDLVTGWALFLSLAVSIGVVIGRWAVLSRSASQQGGPAASPEVAARLGRASATALLLSLALVFVRQLIEFRDPFVPWSHDVRVLMGHTSWGATWLAAVGAAVLALGGFWQASRGRRGFWWITTASTLALGAFPAMTGHANAGDLRRLTLVADTLHVWAVGAWIGGLALVLFLDHRRDLQPAGRTQSLLPALVPRFSSLAVLCVCTVVLTGLLSAWVHLGSVKALFQTGYGRLLLLKVGLVLGVLALGAWNWRRLTPALAGFEGQTAMRRSATVELLLANAVLVVTALLVRTPPT